MTLAFNSGKSKKRPRTKKVKCSKTLPDNANIANVITKENTPRRKKGSKFKSTGNSTIIAISSPSSTQNKIETTIDTKFTEKSEKGQKSPQENISQTTVSCDKMVGSARRSLRNRKASSIDTSNQAGSSKKKPTDAESHSDACEALIKNPGSSNIKTCIESQNTLPSKSVSNRSETDVESTLDLQVNNGDILRIMDEPYSQCGDLMASLKTAVDCEVAMSTPVKAHSRRTSRRRLSGATPGISMSTSDYCIITTPTAADVGSLRVRNISHLMEQPESNGDDDVTIVSETISKPKMRRNRFRKQQGTAKKKQFFLTPECELNYRKQLLLSREKLQKQMYYVEQKLKCMRPIAMDFPDKNLIPKFDNVSPISISDDEDGPDVLCNQQNVDRMMPTIDLNPLPVSQCTPHHLSSTDKSMAICKKNQKKGETSFNISKARVKCSSSFSKEEEESTEAGKRADDPSSKQGVSNRILSPSTATSHFKSGVDEAVSENPVIIDGSNPTNVEFSNSEDAVDHETDILIQQIDNFTNGCHQSDALSSSECFVTLGSRILLESDSPTHLQKITGNSDLLPHSNHGISNEIKDIIKDDFELDSSNKSCRPLKKCGKKSNVDSLKINASAIPNDRNIKDLPQNTVYSGTDTISRRNKSKRRVSTNRESLVTDKLPSDKNDPLKESIDVNMNVCNSCTSVRRGRNKNITCPHGKLYSCKVESKTVGEVSQEESKIKLEKSNYDEEDDLRQSIILNGNFGVKKCLRSGNVKLEIDSSAKRTGCRNTSDVIDSHGDDLKNTTGTNTSLNSADKEHLLNRKVRTSMRLRSIKKETESCVETEKVDLKDTTCRKLLFNKDVIHSDSSRTDSGSKLSSNDTKPNKNQELVIVLENSRINTVGHVDVDKGNSVTYPAPSDLHRKQDREGKSKKKDISDKRENTDLKSKECTDQDTLLKVSSFSTTKPVSLEDVEVREISSTPKSTTEKHPSYESGNKMENNEKSKSDNGNTTISSRNTNSQEGTTKRTENSNIDKDARCSSGGNESGSEPIIEKEKVSFVENDEKNFADLENAKTKKMSVNKSKSTKTQKKKDSEMFNSSKSIVNLEKNEPLNELSDQTGMVINNSTSNTNLLKETINSVDGVAKSSPFIEAEAHKIDELISDLISDKRESNKDKQNVEETEMESEGINCDDKKETSTVKKPYSNDSNENLISCFDRENYRLEQSSSKKINVKNNSFVSEEGKVKRLEMDCDSEVPKKKSKTECVESDKKSGKYKKERRVTHPVLSKPESKNKCTKEKITEHSYEVKSTSKKDYKKEKKSPVDTVSQSTSKEVLKFVSEDNNKKKEQREKVKSSKNDSRKESSKSPLKDNKRKDESEKCTSVKKDSHSSRSKDSRRESIKSPKQVETQNLSKNPIVLLPEEKKKKDEHKQVKSVKTKSPHFRCADSAQEKLKSPKEVETLSPTKNQKKKSLPKEDKKEAEHERVSSTKKDSSPSNRERKLSEHSNVEVEKDTDQKSKRKLSLPENSKTKDINAKSEGISREADKISKEVKTDKDKRSDDKQRKSAVKPEEKKENESKKMYDKGKTKLNSSPSQNQTCVEESKSIGHNSDKNSKHSDVASSGSKRKLNSPAEMDPPFNKKLKSRPSLDKDPNKMSKIQNSIDNVARNVKLQVSDLIEVTLDSFNLECTKNSVTEYSKNENLFPTLSNTNSNMEIIHNIKNCEEQNNLLELNKNQTLDSNDCEAIPDISDQNIVTTIEEVTLSQDVECDQKNSSQDHVPFTTQESPVSPINFGLTSTNDTTIKEQIVNRSQDKSISSVSVRIDEKITSEDVKHPSPLSPPKAEVTGKSNPKVVSSKTSLPGVESSDFNFDDGISLASNEDLSEFNISNPNVSLEVPVQQHFIASPSKRSSTLSEEKIGFKMRQIVIEGVKMFKYSPPLKCSGKPRPNEKNIPTPVLNSSKDETMSLDGEATLLKMVGFHADKSMECDDNSQEENMKKETDLVKFFKPYCGDLLKYNMCDKNNCPYSHQFDDTILSKTDFPEVWSIIEKLLSKSEGFYIPVQVFQAVTHWLGSQGKRNKLLEPGLYLASLSPEKVSSQYLSRCWSALMTAYRQTGVDKVSAAQNILQHLVSHSPPYPVKMLQDIVYFIGLLEYDVPDVWPVVRVLRNVPHFQFTGSFFERLMINTVKVKRPFSSELQNIFKEFTNDFLLLDFDILKNVDYDVIDNFSECLITYKVFYFDIQLQSLLRKIREKKENELSNVSLSTAKLDSLSDSKSSQVFVSSQVVSEKFKEPKTITTEAVVQHSQYNKNPDMSTESDTSTFESQSDEFCTAPGTSSRKPLLKAQSRNDFSKSGYNSDSSMSSQASITNKIVDGRHTSRRENNSQASKNFNETFRGVRQSHNSYSDSRTSFRNKSTRWRQEVRPRGRSLDRSTYIDPWERNELPQIQQPISPWASLLPLPAQPLINYQEFSFHSAENLSARGQLSNYFQTSCQVETNQQFDRSRPREYDNRNQAWTPRERNRRREFPRDNRFKKDNENKLLEENSRRNEASSQGVLSNDVVRDENYRNPQFNQYPGTDQFRKQHFENSSQSELDSPQEASADVLKNKYDQATCSFSEPLQDLPQIEQLKNVVSYKPQNPSPNLPKDIDPDRNLSDGSKIDNLRQNAAKFQIFPKLSDPRVSKVKYLPGDNSSSDVDSSDSSCVRAPSGTWSETYKRQKSKMLSLPFPRGTVDTEVEDTNNYSTCETKSVNRTPCDDNSTAGIYKTQLTGKVNSSDSFKNPDKSVVILNQNESIKASVTVKMNINITPQKLKEIRQSIVVLLEEKRLVEIFQVVCDWSENVQVMESLAFSILGAFKSIDNHYIYPKIREFFAILFKYQKENPTNARNHNLHCLFGTVAISSMMELVKNNFWKNAHDIYSLLQATGFSDVVDERFTSRDDNLSQVCLAIAICEVLMMNKKYEQAINIISENKLLLDRDQWVLIGNDDDIDLVRQISYLLLETMCENSADENIITNFMTQVIDSQKSLQSPINVMKAVEDIIGAYHDSLPDKKNLWLKNFYDYLRIHDSLIELSDLSLRVLLINFIRLRSRKADEIFSLCLSKRLYPEFNLCDQYIPIYSCWQKEEMWFILDKWFEAIAQHIKKGGDYRNSEFFIKYMKVDVSKVEDRKRPERLIRINQALEQVHSRLIQALGGCNPPLIYECYNEQNRTVKLHTKQCLIIIEKKLRK